MEITIRYSQAIFLLKCIDTYVLTSVLHIKKEKVLRKPLSKL